MVGKRGRIVVLLIGGLLLGHQLCNLPTSCDGAESGEASGRAPVRGVESVSVGVTPATLPSSSQPVSAEVASDGTSQREWERIEKEGKEWVKSQVAKHRFPFFRESGAEALLAKVLPMGQMFKVEPYVGNPGEENVIRGLLLRRGTSYVVFEGTVLPSGKKFAMKMLHREKKFFASRRTAQNEVIADMTLELGVADIFNRAYGQENLLSKGLVLPVEVRRIRGQGDFITRFFSRTLFWNSVIYFPLMTCTLAELLSVPKWPREARLYVAKRLLEIGAAVLEAGVLHGDINERNVFHKEGSGEVFLGEFGPSNAKVSLSGKSFQDLYRNESTMLGWLMLRVYNGAVVRGSQSVSCSNSVSFSSADKLGASGPEDEVIRKAIRSLLTCTDEARKSAEDIVKVTPFFRREKAGAV